MTDILPEDREALAVTRDPFRIRIPPKPDYVLQGFGTLKWTEDHYEFEGDPHESARVFASALVEEVNALERTREKLKAMRERAEAAEARGKVLEERLGKLQSTTFCPPPVGRWPFFDGSES